MLLIYAIWMLSGFVLSIHMYVCVYVCVCLFGCVYMYVRITL